MKRLSRRYGDTLMAAPEWEVVSTGGGTALERLAELLREPCDPNDRMEARAIVTALRRPAAPRPTVTF